MGTPPRTSGFRDEWQRGKAPAATVWSAHGRLRAPYRILCAIFGSDGDDQSDGGKVTTQWRLTRRGAGTTAAKATWVFVHDRQEEDNRKFSIENFRKRPHYDWYVDSLDEATLAAFCKSLAVEVVKRVEAEPQAKRLTAASTARINELVAKGTPMPQAVKEAAEWELIAIATELYRWPIANSPKDV